MSNTTPAEPRRTRLGAAALAVAVALAAAWGQATHAQESKPMNPTNPTQATAPAASETLTARQQAIVPIAAFAAAGDMPKLNAALNQGLDAGMTISDAREVPADREGRCPAGRWHGQPDQAVGRAGRRAAVRLRARRERVPANPSVRRHLRARQPRLAGPRAGHGEHAVGAARCRVATAGAHAHQHEHRPHGGPVAPAHRGAGRTRRCRHGAPSEGGPGAAGRSQFGEMN